MKVFILNLSLLGLVTLSACSPNSSDASNSTVKKEIPSPEKPTGPSFPERLTFQPVEKKFKIGNQYDDFHQTVYQDTYCLNSEYLEKNLVQNEPVKNSVLYQLKVSELAYSSYHLSYTITTTVIAINSKSYLAAHPAASDVFRCEYYVAETFTGDYLQFSESFDLEGVDVEKFHSEFPRELSLEVRDLDPTKITEIFNRRDTMIDQLKTKYPNATRSSNQPELSHAMDIMGISLPEYVSQLVKRSQSEEINKAKLIPYIKVGWATPQN